MDAKKRTRLLPIAVALVIPYLAFFPNNAGRELVVRPAWSRRLESAPSAGPVGDTALAFRVGELFGYVDPQGALLRLERVYFDVTLNDSTYANYSKGAVASVVRNRRGDIIARLDGSAWPLVPRGVEDRFYLFSTDSMGLSEVGMDGAVRWTRDFPSFMTCFDVFRGEGEAHCVVGTADGSLVVLGSDGAELYRTSATGSRIQGVYGCAVSPEGDQIAAVLGLDPQRLLVVGRAENGFTKVWERKLEPELRAERLLCYSGGAGYLIADGVRGLEIHEGRGGRAWRVAGDGYLMRVALVGSTLVAEMRGESGGGELLVVLLPDRVIGRARLPEAPPAARSLSGYDGYFLFGASDQVARYDLLES